MLSAAEIQEQVRSLQMEHDKLKSETDLRLAILRTRIETLQCVLQPGTGPKTDFLFRFSGPLRSPDTSTSSPTSSPTSSTSSGSLEKPGPTDAIIAWLKDHPDGGSRAEIVNALKDQIGGDAKDKARCLLNTLSFLIKKNRVVEPAPGRVRMSEVAM